MELQTIVKPGLPEFSLDYATRMMLVGSCFTENMGEKLKYFRFPVEVNPCGIVYNPLSVAATLDLLIEGRYFTVDDLLQNEGKWVSLSHHGSFSDSDAGQCLVKINSRIKEAAAFLKQTDVLIITWGTAWVYYYRKDGCLVANCHKLPATDFQRSRLEIGDIVAAYSLLLERLFALRPGLKVLLTVSPIRHWKDGAHGNQLSKATLLLAVEQLVERFTQVTYFPSYEIVMDELRDYRFYAADMLHISSQGIEYIWEKFKNLYIGKGTQEVMKKVDKLNRQLLHRPSDPGNKDWKLLREKAEGELKRMGLLTE